MTTHRSAATSDRTETDATSAQVDIGDLAVVALAYGVVPDQWLRWADNRLVWRSDKLLLAVSSKGVKFGDAAKTFGGTGRILITYQALRDMIAAGIYIVMLGVQIALGAMLQKRG